ncbi:protein cornichon homolog 4 isoform X1 [Poecilia reticulata]|uniref:protein cornichon homolog 4 isoform X1 n=1 Tax=Poecilia reticulata TaxID=8081 RepID=UPI0004A2288A|nr:PREDICTED: protein cornichon homolog 4 isoform X1 [Poecilia reticulata]
MEATVFILSLVDCCALIFLSVYFIITLSDLECDYINARACCSKLNKWVIPEMVGQCLSMMLMLVSMHWFIFLLNMPVAAWNIYRSTSPGKEIHVPLGGAQEKTQDTLEGLCISAGLGTPYDPPGGAGPRGWGKESLGLLT